MFALNSLDQFFIALIFLFLEIPHHCRHKLLVLACRYLSPYHLFLSERLLWFWFEQGWVFDWLASSFSSSYLLVDHSLLFLIRQRISGKVKL